jgi:hypothetical protein
LVLFEQNYLCFCGHDAIQERDPVRKSLIAAIALAALALQTNTLAQARGNEDLSSFQLIRSHQQPSLDVDLACTGETATSDVQCATVRAAFEEWADQRGITLHSGSKDDPEFDGKLAPSEGAPMPRHMAVLFEPVVVPPMHNWSGTFNTMSNSYTPGSAGDRATVFIYDAHSGALTRKLKLHDRKQLPDNADVTPAMKSEIQGAIAKLDQGASP